MATQAALDAAIARIAALESAQASALGGVRRQSADGGDAFLGGAVNPGDTAWILTSTCLVLMMTIPGLALFYGGLSRAQNVLSTVMQSFAITCFVSILWFAVGYSLAFAGCGEDDNCDYIGGGDKIWLLGDTKTGKPVVPGSASGTLPEPLFVMFQMTFAIITCAIITGSVAERMKFSALLVFIFFWHLLIYCPIAHWEWGGGFMGKWGVLDFAGGDVVHISSGVSGLVASIVVGKRRAWSSGAELPPHNVLLTFLGASLLWVGWFGFNAGSAVTAGGSAAMAMLVTHIAASTAGFTWMLLEWMVKGKPTVLGVVSGAIAGLVVITPGAGYVDQSGAFVMGLLGGVGCYAGIQFKHMVGIDDALDAFGIHGVGGIIGGILTGLFANPNVTTVGGQDACDASKKLDGDASEICGPAGAFYGNGEQLGWQIAGILIVALYSAAGTALILGVLGAVLPGGLRVSETAEDEGLDISEHGEALYDTKKGVETFEAPPVQASAAPPAPMPQYMQPMMQPGMMMGQPGMMGAPMGGMPFFR
eukprot:GHVU01078784.1.p1 GENE.GHVU01078784.1~~GHVU01078784.1.p1  ORF type:complete len:541 (+),score=100.49 GHVU01078784.1:23-1624(+)